MPPKSKKRLAADRREARKAELKAVSAAPSAQTYEPSRYRPQDPYCEPYWDAFYENPYPRAQEWKGLSERLNMRPETLRIWFAKARQFTYAPDRGPEDDIEGDGDGDDNWNSEEEGKVLSDQDPRVEGTLYAHFYRNVLYEQTRPAAKRNRSSTVTKDDHNVQAGGSDIKKSKTTHHRGPRGPYNGQSRTTTWRNQTHARKYASDIRAFFPTVDRPPKNSTGSPASPVTENVVIDSESEPESVAFSGETVGGAGGLASGTGTGFDASATGGNGGVEPEIEQDKPEDLELEWVDVEVVGGGLGVERAVAQENDQIANQKNESMSLETYRKALELLEASMHQLKLDVPSPDCEHERPHIHEDEPHKEGPTPQDAEDAMTEPVDLLDEVDEDSRDEPYHIALGRHLNRLLNIEKKSKTPNAKRLIELTALSDNNNLRKAYVDARYKSPSTLASNRIAEAKFVPTAKKPVYQHESWYARHLRAKANHLVRVGSLPESKQGKGGTHYSLLAEEDVKRSILSYLRTLKAGRISPMRLRREVNQKILPELGIMSPISESTARRWLVKLGYRPVKHSKGMYIDGHERSDVVEYRASFLELIKSLQPLMQQYDDETDEPIPLILPEGAKRHVPVAHDESCFHANDREPLIWVREGEQELRQKGRGRVIHVSDFESVFREKSDGTVTTARRLVPECLNAAGVQTIRHFWRKTWRYMDAYLNGLTGKQAEFAVKKFKSHRRIGKNVMMDIRSVLN